MLPDVEVPDDPQFEVHYFKIDNPGFLIGVGFRFLEHFSADLLPGYGFGDTLHTFGSSTRILGGNVTVYADVLSLLRKKSKTGGGS